MTGFDPNAKNVTVIHLTGDPNSSANDREIAYHGDENDNFTTKELKNDLQPCDNNLLKENFDAKNIYENLRYFYYPSNNVNRIQKQNVGIRGKISMTCEPIYENYPCHFDDESLIGPYSLMSVHESIIESCNSCQHYTTITIGKRNLVNLDLESLRGPKIYFEESQPKLKHSHASQTEMMRPVMINKEMQVNLDSITSHNANVDHITQQNIKSQHVTNDANYRHEICENCYFDNLQDDSDFDQDSISSFSSAYTVTECELATSETSSSNNCCKIPPKTYDTPNLIEWSDKTFFEEIWKHSINISTKNSANDNKYDVPKNIDKTKTFCKKNDNRYEEKKFINNNNSFIYEEMLNYFFSQMEQKDKNEDELWISNEATISSNVANKNVDFSLPFAIAPPKVFPQINPKVQGGKNTDQNNKFRRRLSSVTFDQRESEGVFVSSVEAMTAFLPPSTCNVSQQQRNHFTNRQMITGPLPNYHEGKDSWNKENRLRELKEVNSTAQLTSTVDNRPSKRFSFLVRSNSVTEGGNKEHCKVPANENAKNEEKISPSDKAILDRLSELKITSIPANIVKTPRPSGYTQKNPPCGRCGEPVYPQELVKPTEELYYHSACFKCQQCGIKLNLRTFFRCSSPTKDSRIFCKAHLPPSDTRKANSDNVMVCISIDFIIH